MKDMACKTYKIPFLVFAAVIFMAASVSAVEPPPRNELEKRIDSLFVIASSGELKYIDLVQPAVDSIAAIGAPAVPRLVEKYTTKSARERLAINQILVKIGSDGVPYLTRSQHLDNPEQVSRISGTLGEIKDKMAVPELIKTAFHENWWVRSACAGAFGQIGDSAANDAVLALLVDTVETVRKSAAVSAGQLLIEASIPLLIHMLGDQFYGARLSAAEALTKFGDRAVKPLVDSLNSANELVGNLGCSILGQIGGDMVAVAVAGQLEHSSPIRRALAVEAIYNSNSSLACGLVELMSETETDPTVKFYIARTLNKYAP